MASGNPSTQTNARYRADQALNIDSMPLLGTKLYRPPVSPNLEQRNRLLVRLDQNRQRPLTLISAPAGYGKTILASQWLESCNCSSAWYSLDESDNDLRVFVSYFLAAVSGTFPDLAFRSLNLLDAPNPPSITVFARALINDLDQIHETFILVLDDIHLIHDHQICDLFDLLLQHPPRHLHLVLIGRHDPAFEIIPLRARSQVTEIRTFDLRFTTQETIRLMRKMLNREIDPKVAADWTQRTDGWVTALRLAVLSLRHRGQDDDLSLRIRGDSRYLRDYLLAEVLSRVPASYQNYLIKISFLDRFCGSLCEAIFHTDINQDTEGMNGKTFIDWLECENLFLIPLDDQYQWFRFHHLFQEHLLELLKTQLNIEEISTLQMRASSWFSKNRLLDDAIRYALAAGENQAAVHLVEQHRYELMNTQQWHRLERWLNLLPAEVVDQNPLLKSAKAFLGLYSGQDQAIFDYLEFVERLLPTILVDDPRLPVIQAEHDALQSIIDIAFGRVASGIARAQNSRLHLPPQAKYAQSIAVITMALCLQMEGNFASCLALLQGELDSQSWSVELKVRLTQSLCIAFMQEGDLTGLIRFAAEYLPLAEKLQLGESISDLRYFIGTAHYLRYEFAQAENYLLALLEDRITSAPSYLANGIFVLALMYQAEGREAEADQVIDTISATLRDAKDLSAWTTVEAFRVELVLRRGRVMDARRLSQGIEFHRRPPLWFFYVPQLTEIKLLLTEGGLQNIKEACTRLETLAAEMAKINRNNVRIDALSLLALARATQGDQLAAFSHIHEALRLGYRGRFIRTFIDLGQPMADLLADFQAENPDFPHRGYLDQIMAAFPKNQHAQGFTPDQSKLVEPLTDRELEVLTLLAQRLSNKEIAAKLVISPRTVKRHTLNIYQKLDVNSRLQAVEKAAELGIHF